MIRFYLYIALATSISPSTTPIPCSLHSSPAQSAPGICIFSCSFIRANSLGLKIFALALPSAWNILHLHLPPITSTEFHVISIDINRCHSYLSFQFHTREDSGHLSFYLSCRFIHFPTMKLILFSIFQC